MPYILKKQKTRGYKVCKRGTRKCFSKRPLTKRMAKRQMRALYLHERVGGVYKKRRFSRNLIGGGGGVITAYNATNDQPVSLDVSKTWSFDRDGFSIGDDDRGIRNKTRLTSGDTIPHPILEQMNDESNIELVMGFIETCETADKTQLNKLSERLTKLREWKQKT